MSKKEPKKYWWHILVTDLNDKGPPHRILQFSDTHFRAIAKLLSEAHASRRGFYNVEVDSNEEAVFLVNADKHPRYEYRLKKLDFADRLRKKDVHYHVDIWTTHPGNGTHAGFDCDFIPTMGQLLKMVSEESQSISNTADQQRVLCAAASVLSKLEDQAEVCPSSMRLGVTDTTYGINLAFVRQSMWYEDILKEERREFPLETPATDVARPAQD